MTNQLSAESLQNEKKRDADLIAAVRIEIEECDTDQALPARIGRYRILGRLGRGGMGVVYRAIQDFTNREVALKIIVPGLASHKRLNLFAREVELLAQLRHPGIVQVYEADVVDTECGRQPFFAMEIINGSRLTDFVEAAQLGTQKRLELLANVCDAIQHAHQKGIIHRDLKPANILVDGNGHPKVLDFGVACATGTDLETTMSNSSTAHLIGTLPYMSPEHLGNDASAIDTRSDIYALGVIGYELLVGRLPYDVAGKTIPEVARIVREESPTSLGTRERHLRGDIITILAKALEKDPNHRYSSMSAMGSDIRRYLRNEPIQAAPPRLVYRLRKFARRNRTFTAAVLVGLLGLVATTTGTSIGLMRARKAEKEAVRNAQMAAHTTRFLQNIFSVSDPNVPDPSQLTTREILDRGAQQLEEDLSSEPEVKAAMQYTLGRVFANLGLLEQAHALCQSSLETRREALGPDHPDSLEAMYLLATVSRRQGDLDEAEKWQRELVERRSVILGSKHPHTLTSMNELASVLILKESLPEAEKLLRSVLRTRVEELGFEHASTISSMSNLAVLLRLKDERREAEQLYREALAASCTSLGEEHPRTLNIMNNLAALLLIDERTEHLVEADNLSRKVLAVCRRDPTWANTNITLDSLHNRAAVLCVMEKLDEAERMSIEVLEKYRNLRGEEHHKTLAALNTYAFIIEKLGRLEEAEQIRRQLLANYKTADRPGHSRSCVAALNLATLLERLDQFEEADRLFREIIDTLETSAFPHSMYLAVAKAKYGHSLFRQDRYAEAEPLLRTAYQELTQTLHKEHRYARDTAADLLELCIASNRPDEAAKWEKAQGLACVATASEDDSSP